MRKVLLGTWVEITIPNSRILEEPVRDAMYKTVAVIGGATLTQGLGFYVREDEDEDALNVDRERVTIARWDFDMERPDIDEVMSALRRVVDALLEAGEQCVLRRTNYCHPSYGFTSELLFADK